MGVVVLRRYIDILTIIINFPYSTCISSFFGSSILTSLFILKLKMFFWSLYICDPLRENQPHAKNMLKTDLQYFCRIYSGCKFETDILFFDQVMATFYAFFF